MAHATLMDLMVFCMYSKCCAKDVWRDIGAFIWPGLLFMIGNALEQCAHMLADTSSEPAPLLKTKKGRTKRIPLGNKLLLLKKTQEVQEPQKTNHGQP